MTRHRFSVEEFHRRVEAGVFPEDLEPVEGGLLERGPIGPKHAATVKKFLARLAPLLERGTAPRDPQVADTTLEYDPKVKPPLYAAGGVPEVWMVDLGHRRVLVHPSPQGRAQREAEALGPGETLNALGLQIPLEELL